MKQRLLLVGFLAFAAGLGAEERWGRNAGYGRPEANLNRLTYLAEELEVRTDRFREQFDREIDRTRWNGTSMEDRLWERTKRLENEVDEIRKELRRRDYRDIESNIARAMGAARDIDTALRRIRLSPDTHRNWSAIRSGLFELARNYRRPY